MKRFIFIALLILSFVFGAIVQSGYDLQKPTVAMVNKPLDAVVLWSLIQNWRLENNRKAYIKDQRLCKIAETRIEEIKKDDFSHDQFLKKYADYPSTISENIARKMNIETGTLDTWLESPTHKENLDKNYLYSCVVTKDSYAVQIFSSCENGCP